MNEFDQFMKHNLRIQYYIRYTDDFVIIHHDQEHLWRLKDRIDDFLRTYLQLTLHPTKISVRKYSEGIDFLGYVVLPYGIILRTKTKKRIMKKMKIRIAEYRAEKISEKQLLQTINSYLAVLSHADSYKLRQKILHSVWSSLKSPD